MGVFDRYDYYLKESQNKFLRYLTHSFFPFFTQYPDLWRSKLDNKRRTIIGLEKNEYRQGQVLQQSKQRVYCSIPNDLSHQCTIFKN